MSPVRQVIRCKLCNNNYLQLLADVCRMICRANHWLGLPYSCRRRSIAKTMRLITRHIVPSFSAVANHNRMKFVNNVRRWSPSRLDSPRDVQNRLRRLPSMPSMWDWDSKSRRFWAKYRACVRRLWCSVQSSGRLSDTCGSLGCVLTTYPYFSLSKASTCSLWDFHGVMSIAGFAQVSFRIKFRAVLLTPYHKGNNSYSWVSSVCLIS